MVVPGRHDFLHMKAPEGYVAGIGRGATGFTTRSDLGPAREGPTEDMVKAALERRQRDEQRSSGAQDDGGDGDEGRYEDADEEAGLFASLPYDQEDAEADRIWQAVDDKMAERRKRQREMQEQAQMERAKAEGTKIQRQFVDAKRALSEVTEDEWASLPEVGDLTKKRRLFKEPRRERFYAVSDTFLAQAHDQVQFENSIEASPAGEDGAASSTESRTNFEEIGAARDKMLGIKLDQASTAGTSSTIDPKGYLTGLNSMIPKMGADVGDIKKARLLLQSVTNTNPKHAPGWIAAARLEEIAGKTVQARNVIAKGCENCPTNEDVWLESVRLNTVNNAKVILAEAVRHIPKSVRLWLQACDLEADNSAKQKVLRRALEMIPNSVKLWKEAVNLEDDPRNARLLLARAVELIPESVELWLALARLETSANARKVLNKARMTLRTSYEVWIAAARLEEQEGNETRVDMVISRGFKELQKLGGLLQREQWISEAEKCEADGGVVTAQAIIRVTLGQGVDEAEQEDTWLDDAEGLTERGSIYCARAVYAYALRVYPKEYTFWRKAADLEKDHGTKESLEDVLEKAVDTVPEEEILWLMYAKERWTAGDVTGAREVLSRAFEHNPNSEEIWLAAVKLEFESREDERARKLLQAARSRAGTERVWVRSVTFARQVGDVDEALDLVNEALKKFEKNPKFWIMLGQIYEDKGMLSKAREAYQQGVKHVPKSVPLWILFAHVEDRAGVAIRARNVLERARLANPKTPRLWYESIVLELETNRNLAKTILAKAMQDCPSSGLLWSLLVLLEPRTQQRPRAIDGLRKADSDPYLLTTVARVFWNERKYDKAKDWFLKAIKANNDIGDTWAWFYKFTCERGSPDDAEQIAQGFEKASPRHGMVWPTVAKANENSRKSLRELLMIASEAVAKAAERIVSEK